MKQNIKNEVSLFLHQNEPIFLILIQSLTINILCRFIYILILRMKQFQKIKLFSTLLFISLLVAYANSGFVNPGSPTIIEVSTSLDSFVSPTGSTQGGTTIFIKGTNFSPFASDNNIMIGPYPCLIIADGTKQDTLSCTTTPATDPTKMYGLPVSVTVGQVFVSCNSNNCAYNYREDQTPVIDQIIPRSVIGGGSVYIFGSHRITNLGDGRSPSDTDIKYFLIDDRLCSMIDVLQDQDGYNPNSRSQIQCLADITQVAGEYKFTELVKPGYARQSLRTLQTSYFTQNNYTQRVLAQISSISAHLGGTNGHLLVIKGFGFSSSPQNSTCTIAGQVCSVISASLTELTIKVPPLSGSNVAFGALTKDSGDSTTQQKKYLGGNGLNYKRYDRQDLWKSLSQWLTYLRGTPSINLVSQKIITQLSSPEVYGENYVQYVKGYFYAPVDGIYRFSVTCDDKFLMMMSSVKNNGNVGNLQMLLQQDDYNYNHYSPYTRANQTQTTKNLTLTQGYYYFELVNLNYGGGGFFKVMADMPSLFAHTTNPTWQTDRLVIKPTQYDPQILKLTVYGASGSFKIFYYAGTILNVAEITIGASANSFKDSLYSLPNIAAYDPAVTLQTLDVTGNPSSTGVQGYEYTLTFNRYRPATDLPYTSVASVVSSANKAKSITLSRTLAHSPPLSGTFGLFIGGSPLQIDSNPNIPYNIESWKLQSALNAFYQTKQISVSRVIGTQAENSIQLIIQYVGLVSTANTLTLDTTLLAGGFVGTSPTGSVEIVRQYSDRWFYSPIPYQFLNIASEKPSLKITTNSLPAVCSDCSYQFQPSATPVLSSAVRSGATYTLAVTDPTNLGFTIADIQVSFLGTKCLTLIGTISSFTCTLQTNADNSPALPAGTGKPLVHISQLGFATNAAINTETITLIISNYSPSETSPGGGVQATITGSGFPLSKASVSEVMIQVCGNSVNQESVTVISNQQIKFIIPLQQTSCNGSNNLLTFGGQSKPFTFAYNPTLATTITSLSKTSSSPILKSTIDITGTNFGTQSTTKVFLVQDGLKKYELSIVSISSTLISCILGGGRSGLYDVVIQDSINGLSKPNANSKFSYKIVVTSLSITSGHKGGGYVLTVNGLNFATATGTNNVFIGNAKNSICSIISSTSTSITCTVPRMMDEYSVDTPLDVVVTGRIVEESVCQGTCTFSYEDAGTSIVNVPASTVFRAGDNVTITGTGLSAATVKVNKVTCAIVQNNATAVIFTYPAIPAGSYEIFITVSNGWTYPQVISKTQLAFLSASTSSGSYRGAQLKIIGNGLPDISKLAAWFVCSSTSSLKILSSTAVEVNVLIPPFALDTDCKVNITSGTKYTLFNYQYRTNSTCSITVSGTGPFTLTKNNMTTTYTYNKVQFVWLDSAGNPTNSKYLMAINNGQVSAPYLAAGNYQIRVHSDTLGFAYLTNSQVSVAFAVNPSFSTVGFTSSFVGGKQLTINGQGFVTNNPQNNQISVCGLRANIIGATQQSVTISIPALVTTSTQSDYLLSSNGQVSGISFGDNTLATNAIDNSFNTIYTSSNAACWVGINFGANAYVDITQIRYVPNPAWPIAAIKLDGAVFEGSNDGTTYTQIFAVDTSQVHSGWNVWQKLSNSYQYQYVRFKHTSTSACQLAQLKVFGIKYSTLPITSGTDKSCDILVAAGNILIQNALTYSHAATSVVNTIDPSFGPSVGGTVVHITGSGFGTTPTVVIDGVNCPVVNTTSTEIYCTTGVRSSPPSSGNSFVVNSDGNVAKIATNPYLYVDRWSSTNTWGGQAIPREGDTIYVPKGMTLLVDLSTPLLDTVIVQGKIQFQDTQDLTFDARYFVISGGQFQAGTETDRFQHKLVITLHGGYFDKQLPTLGNKVLGCRNCKFNMHGKIRKTWTLITQTIMPGNLSFTVNEPVDWVNGDRIAVAATSFDHYQTQQMEVSSVSGDGLTVTVKSPFRYKHFAAIQTYGSDNIVMRAQVGLLTRNIVVKGDDNSVNQQYGSHLMLTGKQSSGLVGKISYAQFTKCGQPKIVGRYCTHFHMAGEVPDSYVRGISVHHSFARVLTIHGTHFLLVEKNVGYFVKGHNIFVEDGIETNNVIQDNLMMSSIASNTMLQSDVTVASYWITNPYNTVRRNHAAGGDFYGFWYQIKDHPDGPSATSDICPMGMQLGISRDNVAHSNRRFGLRIFKLSARKYPCLDTEDQSALDPYTDNPPIHSQFDNYTLWKNEECGFLGQELGYTTISNFKTIDSRKGGLQFHKTNFTKQLVVASNCLVVGYSSGNAPADIDTDYNNARGIIASRTDGLKFSGIKFYNFGPTMTPLKSCSECYNFKLWVVGSKTTLFENIQYNNIQGKYIFWEKWRRQVFIDLDGTLTQPFQTAISPAIATQSKASISPYRPSLMVPNHCYSLPSASDLWDNSVYCDQTVTMRSIMFTNGIPFIDFNAIDIKVNLMVDGAQNVTLETQSDFSQQYMIIIKKSQDKKNSWAMPFAVNHFYNVHWKWGVDFTHMAVAPSRLWENNEGVVLRFNYSDHRQVFQIGKWYQQKLQLPFMVANNSVLDPTTCSNAEYYHDPDNKYLYVCVSGRNKTTREWIDINGIRCINFCPPAEPTTQRQSFSRLWSNTSMWPNQALPTANQNVTIPYEWNVVLDIDPPILNYVEINGILIFDKLRNNTFQANYIWVKQGIIRIGDESSPFPNLANIILHGGKNSSYLVVDPDASGNKMLAVTGGLQFYGKQPQTAWTRLVQTALVGANQIKVLSAADWNVGDHIVIAPSYTGQKQFEQVIISSISGTTITFTPSLHYEHYGAATTTIENSYGILDTRSAVGLLTRNIKITAGPDPDNWGCRVLVYGYNEIHEDITIPPVWRNGYAKLKGVEFDKCGQYDSTYAALRIQNVGSNPAVPNSITTQVENTAIHGCGGFCTFIKQVSNVHINNNVYFYARKFLVYVQQVISQYNFTNNLLVGARKRDQLANLSQTMMVDDIAAYEQYKAIDFAADHRVNVSFNLAQGSQGQGFVFPATTCELLSSYPFVSNTAGSCQVAFMYEKQDNKECLAAKGCIGYASQIGLMANMPGSHIKVIYSDMFFADNQRGVTLRYAHEIDDNTMIFKNSYVTGISRPTCTNCYGDSKISYCQGGYAVRMFTATISGQTFPLKKKPTGHDVICTQQSYDFKAFLDNVTFENYLYSNPQLPYCSNMAVFKRHGGASDATASHHLTNTRCINCQTKSWAYFDQPSLSWRGWFGGCGELDCSGPNNYLVHDQDGLFTGEKSQILSNNSMIGDYESFCESVPEMNGHWCHTEELAILQYESIAPDFNKRKMWPIYLHYDGGLWNSTTNAWKQWQWDGPEPMNLRLGRFWSVIKLHQSYNMTYASQPPSDSRFQIQKRLLPTGNANDWAIVRIYYPLPNSIQVLVKNTSGIDIVVKPYPILQGVATDLNTVTNICGANNFHYQNGTIQFVVNGVNNCQVRVRLSSYIQLSARIDIPIADFYSSNGLTSFITNICAFLGIDTGRMKIVGVYSGSTGIQAVIQANYTTLQNSTTSSQDQVSLNNELLSLNARLTSGLSSGSINVLGPLLSHSTNFYVFNDDGSTYKQPKQQLPEQSKVLIIVLAVVIPVIIALAITGGYCYWRRKRAQIHDADILNNNSTVNREHIKGSTQFEISAVDEFAFSTKYQTKHQKKWTNGENIQN